MSDVILRLSTMHFEDAAEFIDHDDVVDGSDALPLIAYEMMLPLLGTNEDDALPILFSFDRAIDREPARLAG